MSVKKVQEIPTYCFSSMVELKHKNEDICNGLSPKEYLKTIYKHNTNSCLSSLRTNGVIRSMGWEYDFKSYLKRYVYKLHNNWHECYAPNKVAVKTSTFGTVKEVIEIPERNKK